MHEFAESATTGAPAIPVTGVGVRVQGFGGRRRKREERGAGKGTEKEINGKETWKELCLLEWRHAYQGSRLK